MFSACHVRSKLTIKTLIKVALAETLATHFYGKNIKKLAFFGYWIQLYSKPKLIQIIPLTVY